MLHQVWKQPDCSSEIDILQGTLTLEGQSSNPREGVIIDHDVILIFPLGRFYLILSILWAFDNQAFPWSNHRALLKFI